MTPHKHAELIKAWADGQEVEALYDAGWIRASPYFNPLTDPQLEWRIKPEEPVKRWLWAYKFSDFDWELVNEMLSDDEAAIRKANNPQNKYMKLSWSETEFEE